MKVESSKSLDKKIGRIATMKNHSKKHESNSNVMLVKVDGMEYFAPSISPLKAGWFEAEKLASELNKKALQKLGFAR